MIDIHCHILYGLDDGASSLEESIEMARQAVQDGVSHVFATPHFTVTHFTHQEVVRKKVNELQQAIDEQGIKLTVHPGNEVRLESLDFLYEHIQHNSFHYLGENDKFILLEQRWSEYDPKITEAVNFFVIKGITPIIAHPERHPYIRQQPELLDQLIESGAWTQVSVDSMLGKNGEKAREFSMTLLDNDLIHTIASDAHNTVRKINLSVGYDIIQERAGHERVLQIKNRIKSIIQ